MNLGQPVLIEAKDDGGGGDRRRIADEYCGGAAVTKFPTKYFRIEFMRREFVDVRVLYS